MLSDSQFQNCLLAIVLDSSKGASKKKQERKDIYDQFCAIIQQDIDHLGLETIVDQLMQASHDWLRQSFLDYYWEEGEDVLLHLDSMFEEYILCKKAAFSSSPCKVSTP